MDFNSLQGDAKGALIALIKSVTHLAAEDLAFQRNVHAEIGEDLDTADDRILCLSTSLLQSSQNHNASVKAPKLDDADDIDLRWNVIVDVIDSLLEKADTCLDEYTGLVKRRESLANQPTPHGARPAQKPVSSSVLSSRFRHANIMKPQLKFERKHDNFAPAPWKPVLTTKPHATVPLDKSLELCVKQDSAGAPGGPQYATHHSRQREKRTKVEEENTPNAKNLKKKKRRAALRYANLPSRSYRHPYELEISHLAYPDWVYDRAHPMPFQPAESTAATWVDTYEGVLEMLGDLKNAREIAVDLEHHDFRTYVGLTSLMQISTREKDWLVDTLKPWRHKLEVLNEVFADPNILKVFHGSYMDMIWLQRDLGLYVVGLFDTSAACEQLSYPARSLAYLLKRFVDFDADKKYQLADWRLRPLPEEMLHYARADTHYLLYIYDHLRNELIDKSTNTEEHLINNVLDKSKELALKIYEGTEYGDDGRGVAGWYKLLFKSASFKMTDQQFAVFRAVHQWRDRLARTEDECIHYIMPNHVVNEITRIVPTDAKALHGLLGHSCRGSKPRLNELLSVIQQAASEKPTMSWLATIRSFSSSNDAQAKTMSKLAPEDVTGNVDVLRARKSQLFGTTPPSSMWEAPASQAPTELNYEVPWAKYVGGMTIDESNESLVSAARETQPEPKPKPAQELDKEFTLKAGHKRKSNALQEDVADTSSSEADSDSDSESNDDDDDDDEDSAAEDDVDMADAAEGPRPMSMPESFPSGIVDPKVPQNSSNKKPKSRRSGVKERARKELARSQMGDGTGTGTAAGYEAFDYSKAPSVIKKGQKKDGRKFDEKKKPGLLFAKNLEGDIKGARRTNYEKPGRSQTFKN